ncbi:S9 family peptidase [Hyphomicrobiales bacterium 4NK60-0047b]
MDNKTKEIRPFGQWEAAISAENVVTKALRFSSLQSTGHYLYWCEQRSQEKGRGVIMRWDEEGGLKQLLPKGYSARSKVHEYGGGEFCVADGKIFFINESDQQVYLFSEGNEPEQITNAPGFRFANLAYDNARDRLIAVAEEHKVKESRESEKLPTNSLVNIGLSGAELGGISIMDDSCDFYASPTISPDHNQLAWLQWNLPHMPWETAECMVSSLDQPRLTPTRIAGGTQPQTVEGITTSACFQPLWDKLNQLYLINDQTGFGQLYKYSSFGEQTIEHCKAQNEEADALRAQWVFGMGSFALSQTGKIIISAFKEGKCHLQLIDEETKGQELTTDALSVEMPRFLGKKIAAILTLKNSPPSVGLIEPKTGKIKIIQEGSAVDCNPNDISEGQLKQFSGKQGHVFGLYYPPTNARLSGEQGTTPPTIITIHGGPTAMADRGLKMKTQYWTNRGYAVFDIDYSGSSGYGTTYRNRLNAKWGIADVNDVVSAAEFLIEEKLADPEKLIVSGGSAGGYTCLMALIKSNLFKCASCNYPVTDLGQLLEITHKFEYGYTYGLTGTTKGNAKQELYERSVLAHIDELNAPVIFFQGMDDKVVPPSQPTAVYEALKEKGIEAQLFLFENEGHGFRSAETIMKVLEEEEHFFKQALDI